MVNWNAPLGVKYCNNGEWQRCKWGREMRSDWFARLNHWLISGLLTVWVWLIEQLRLLWGNVRWICECTEKYEQVNRCHLDIRLLVCMDWDCDFFMINCAALIWNKWASENALTAKIRFIWHYRCKMYGPRLKSTLDENQKLQLSM